METMICLVHFANQNKQHVSIHLLQLEDHYKRKTIVNMQNHVTNLELKLNNLDEQGDTIVRESVLAHECVEWLEHQVEEYLARYKDLAAANDALHLEPVLLPMTTM